MKNITSFPYIYSFYTYNWPRRKPLLTRSAVFWTTNLIKQLPIKFKSTIRFRFHEVLIQNRWYELDRISICHSLQTADTCAIEDNGNSYSKQWTMTKILQTQQTSRVLIQIRYAVETKETLGISGNPQKMRIRIREENLSYEKQDYVAIFFE